MLDEISGVLRDDYPALGIASRDPLVVSGLIDIADDFFQIRIAFPDDYPQSLPLLFETGGHKERLSRAADMSLADLHYQSSGSACLCVSYEARSYIDEHAVFRSFMSRLVVPFLYSQLIFERERRWPFDARGHGYAGKLEYYAERLGGEDYELVLACMKRLARGDRIKPHRLCPCGSGKRVDSCHGDLLRGMAEVGRAVPRTQIKADYEVFSAVWERAHRSGAETGSHLSNQWFKS